MHAKGGGDELAERGGGLNDDNNVEFDDNNAVVFTGEAEYR